MWKRCLWIGIQKTVVDGRGWNRKSHLIIWTLDELSNNYKINNDLKTNGGHSNWCVYHDSRFHTITRTPSRQQRIQNVVELNDYEFVFIICLCAVCHMPLSGSLYYDELCMYAQSYAFTLVKFRSFSLSISHIDLPFSLFKEIKCHLHAFHQTKSTYFVNCAIRWMRAYRCIRCV